MWQAVIVCVTMSTRLGGRRFARDSEKPAVLGIAGDAGGDQVAQLRRAASSNGDIVMTNGQSTAGHGSGHGQSEAGG